jgi:outer membrane protein
MKTKLSLLIALLTITFSFAQEKKWTLKESVEHALKNNITIKQNELNVELSKENVTNAKGNFLPDLGASINPGLNFGSSIGVSGSRISADNFRSSFNVGSNTTLFNGFSNLNTYKQAKLGVESSKLDLQKIQDDISLFVVNAYLNVLFAKENLNVANTQFEISTNQIEVTNSQVEAGVKPKGDLLNAESTAATDAQNVITQENTLDLALLSLAQLLQVSPDNFDVENIDVGSPSIATLYNDSNIVYEKALGNRPEIKRAENNVENSNFDIEIAKGAYMPSLSFSAGLGSSYQHFFNDEVFNNIDFSQQFSDNLGYSFSLSLNIPIFNRGQTKSNVNRSIINKKISEFGLEDQKLQLKETIQRAFLDAKAAAKSFQAAQKSLEAQNEAYKNAQERYNLGAMTLFDFDQVRNRLVDAQSTLIRSKYDYVFKSQVLKFYYGESIIIE